MSSGDNRARAGELLAEALRLIDLRRSHLAVPLLNEALKLDPDNTELRFHAGGHALRQGAPDLALRHLQRCVAGDPGHAAAWAQIGGCHMLAGRHADAAEAYGRARDGRGEGSGPSWRHARALRLCGRHGEAQAELSAVLATPGPETAAVHEQALLCLETGQRQAAETLWRRLAMQGGESLVAASARARLAMLEDPPVRTPQARRVAFHLKSAFHEAILVPGYLACRRYHHVLVSHDAEELVAFDPDVIVACDSHLKGLKTLMPRAATVQTRHGLGSKGHAALLARTCDYFCLSHANQEAFFTAQGIHPPGGYWPIGYLQLDPLLNGSVIPPDLPGRDGRPVVLFAPTIGDSVSALGMLGEDPVATLRPEAESFLLVIKPHPELQARHPSWWQALTASAQRHEGVVLVDEAARDIVPFIAACDLLVTDVSSVMFFAVAADRPLVLLSNPARHSQPDRFDPEGPEWRWRSAGEEIEDAGHLATAIATALADPALHAAGRAACRAAMFGNLTDGRAGERLARRIAGLAPTGR